MPSKVDEQRRCGIVKEREGAGDATAKERFQIAMKYGYTVTRLIVFACLVKCVVLLRDRCAIA